MDEAKRRQRPTRKMVELLSASIDDRSVSLKLCNLKRLSDEVIERVRFL